MNGDVSVDTGSQPSGGMSKRTLILGAIGIGGAIGLFFFLSRKASAPVTNASGIGPASASSQTDLQLGNIANQLLAFRGESSQSFADTLDLLSSNAATATQRDTAMTSLINTGFGGLGSQLTGVGSSINQANDSLGWLSQYTKQADSTLAELYRQASVNSDQSFIDRLRIYAILRQSGATDPALAWLAQQGAAATSPLNGTPDGTPANLQVPVGAGGIDLSDALRTLTYDGGIGDGSYHLGVMSDGPVRIIR